MINGVRPAQTKEYACALLHFDFCGAKKDPGNSLQPQFRIQFNI